MEPELTPATVRAIEAASRWAQQRHAATVRPEHLLLGLIEEEEGRTAVLLRSFGAHLAELRPASRPPLAGPPPPLDAATQEIIHDARTLCAMPAGDHSLSSDRLLFALLVKDEGARQQLIGAGLDWIGLESTIQKARHESLHLHEPLELDEPLRPAPLGERMDAARLLDAAANRAREALRVIEDHCRFVRDDAFLSGELKRLRHDLAAALAQHGPSLDTSLAARETLRDVGTRISTEREHQRQSLADVIAANCKRLQEALCSLEEFGKLFAPALGAELEQLRYRSYTLERALVRGETARQRLADVQLYWLATGTLCTAALDWTIAEAAAGGMDMVQLREKNLPDRQLWERARQVRQWTREADVLFILNDRPDLALLVEADGVHLGQDDLPVKEARRILGPDALIGVSTHSLEQLRQAVLDGADYVGIGPTFLSGTKTFTELAGLPFIEQAARETSLPTFAIGGINADNLGHVVAAGAHRIAISQAIGKSDDPRATATQLKAKLPRVGG